jgi:hypothetical protein
VQLINKAAQFIINIGYLCASNIAKIDQQIQSYRNCALENKFDNQAFEIGKKILETRLKIEINEQLNVSITEEEKEESPVWISREERKNQLIRNLGKRIKRKRGNSSRKKSTLSAAAA